MRALLIAALLCQIASTSAQVSTDSTFQNLDLPPPRPFAPDRHSYAASVVLTEDGDVVLLNIYLTTEDQTPGGGFIVVGDKDVPLIRYLRQEAKANRRVWLTVE